MKGFQFILFFLFAPSFCLYAQDQNRKDMMALARDRYFYDLPFPKDYRPGKYTSYGHPVPGKKETILELNGPGCITRIWNTCMSSKPELRKDDIVHLSVYVDDNKEPVLSGTARAIAAAAQKLSSQSVPWGGFLDGYSVSLYLPIPFQRHIRVEAECNGNVDGPYWQIDYKLGTVPGAIAWKQVMGADGLQIVLANTANDLQKKPPVIQKLTKETFCSFSPVNIMLDGPAVIRKISIKSNYVDNIQLRLAFDGDTGLFHQGHQTDHLNFQVDVPLKYFISKFNTAGIQRIGNEAIIYFPMPFKKKAMLQLLIATEENEFSCDLPLTINIEYEKDPIDINRMYYFNAAASTEICNGYKDFEVLNVRGEGHFVGVNLFNTGHDHGGGDNIFFDAGTNTAGQLHGICAEDYFHHAYMRIGVSAPYIDCPTHSARCRHHIEMPIPFHKSFTFNWGCFAGVIPKAIAMWYQKEIEKPSSHEMTYMITGPFPLNSFDDLMPGRNLPEFASPVLKAREFPCKIWQVYAQNGFIDLCHAFRMYTYTIPWASGYIDTKSCMVATTRVWVTHNTETQFIIGCDDRIRVYLGNKLIGEKSKYNQFDPYEQFSATAKLMAGMNTITAIVANTENTNWHWNGFSLILKNNLNSDQMSYIY